MNVTLVPRSFENRYKTNLGTTYMIKVQEGASSLQQWQIYLKELAECPEKDQVLMFEDLDVLSGYKIRHSTIIQLLFNYFQLLSQSRRDLSFANDRIDKLESLTDELANDLALKEHQLNQMMYHVEESDTLGSWQRQNSWDSNCRF
jgi:hypothetical protein